jgi:hypothetical protein
MRFENLPRMMVRVTAFGFAVAAVGLGCGPKLNIDDTLGSGTDGSTDGGGGGPVVSFTANVKPLLDKNCKACHAVNQSPQFSDYDSTKTYATRIYREIANGSMPPGRALPSSDADIIKAWIDGGYVNEPPVGTDTGTDTTGSTTETTGTTDTTDTTPIDVVPDVVTYEANIAPFMEINCLGCHSSAGGQRPLMDEFSRLKGNADNALCEIETGAMPPGGGVENVDIQIFRRWLALDTPEDIKDVKFDDSGLAEVKNPSIPSCGAGGGEIEDDD